MTGPHRRSFEDLRRDAEHQSDKVLYRYLQAHIFGPFEGDCFAYLNELKFQLQDHGFGRAKVCDDRGNQPPEDASEQERQEFWWSESEEFLINADVAIFVFLDHIFERPSLPERARRLAHEPSDNPAEVNSSAISELLYWLQKEDPEHDRVLVLFEEGIYEKLGSLIPGLVSVRDVRYEVIPNENIQKASKLARKRCMNWAMNEMRDTLQKRHIESL